jgi:hypothetical protein
VQSFDPKIPKASKQSASSLVAVYTSTSLHFLGDFDLTAKLAVSTRLPGLQLALHAIFATTMVLPADTDGAWP